VGLDTRLPPDKLSLLQLQLSAVEGKVGSSKFVLRVVEIEGEEALCTLFVVLKLHG